MATSLLVLGACGQNPKHKSNNSWSYEDPDVKLDDNTPANTEIGFNSVEDNCMVSPKIKAYVDAMEEQEKTLDRPYHFSSLYGPDDYATMAAAADQGDGYTKYTPEEVGGVDVCDMLNRNDYNNKTENYPINLTWDNKGLTFTSAKLQFWSTTDKSDLREVSLGANATSAQLPNLYRARKYRVQLVTDDGKVSQGFEFKTGDYPRVITMGDIKNVRDIGGYVTSYGVRTNQGLIYRGYYIDDTSNSHGKNYTDAAGEVHKEVMKIGVEVDLQKASETGGRTTSCLEGADYDCKTLVSYENFLKEDSYKNLPVVMDYIANADQKHVYFHCWGGADRTGMLAFFINAICGVSYTDLMEDFEITTETNNKRCHMHNSSSAHFPKFLNAFMNEWAGYDDSKTVNENCEKWLLEVPQISAETIRKIREIMIPGYHDGMEQHIPTYTAEGEWKTDGLAHWKVAKEDPNVICNYQRHKGTPCSVCGYNGESGNNNDSSNTGTTDYTQIQTHIWTVTSKANNSDGKEYEQIKDAKNKVGVRILQKNISSTSAAQFDNDHKLPSTGEAVTYQVKAPKAGTYQMIMNGRVSDASYKLSQRGITVKVNGVEVNIEGSNRDGGLVGTGDNDFVMAPSVTLTGNEDTITVACKNYRIAFTPDAYLVFAEH